MTTQSASTVSNPFDIGAFFDVNGRSVEFAEKTYRAWLDGIGRAQNETVRFLKDRAVEDFATVGNFARCTTVSELVDLQTQYATKALSDFVSEGQKIGAIINDAMRQSAP